MVLTQLLPVLDVVHRQLVGILRVQFLVDLPEGVGDVGDDLDVDVIVLVDLGGPEVDVDDGLAAALVPVRGSVFDQIVTHRDHDIGGIERGIGVVALLQADGEQAVGIGTRHRALAHERVDDADADLLGQALELLGGAFAHRAVARKDDRVLGFGNGLHRGAHGLVVGGGAAGLARLDRPGVDLLLGDILGQFEHGDAGLFLLGDLEGLAHHLRDRLGAVDAVRPLADRTHHVDGIHVLVALLVETPGARLADNGDSRRTVHVGVGKAGHQVGHTRAERGQTHARLAGQTAVAVGHEGGRLFVPAQDEVDLAVHQRHHEVGIFLAGNAEDALDALGFQAAHEEIGCFHVVLQNDAGGREPGNGPRPSLFRSLARHRDDATALRRGRRPASPRRP